MNITRLFKKNEHKNQQSGSSILDQLKQITVNAAVNSIVMKTGSTHIGVVGSSRIGGEPDLPKGMAWPKWKGRSLSFIAQISLPEAKKYDKDNLLPSEGILYFFYNQSQETWGFDPEDKGSWAVLYYNGDLCNLSRSNIPNDIDDSARFPVCTVDFSAQVSYPDSSSRLFENSTMSSEDFDAFYEWHNEVCGTDGELRHKLLGHPDHIQGDMQLECQLVSNGLYCGDPSGYHDPRAVSLREGAEDWILLLQIDSDDNAGMMWGDVGRLYYWIKKEDLKLKRFENTWFILQCS